MKVGQYVDLNDGDGFQRIERVTPHWFKLEAGGEFPMDEKLEVRDAEEVELNI